MHMNISNRFIFLSIVAEQNTSDRRKGEGHIEKKERGNEKRTKGTRTENE
jgi:hypothetical protein